MSVPPLVFGFFLVVVAAPIGITLVRPGGRFLRKLTGVPLIVAECIFIVAGAALAAIGFRLIWRY